MRQATDDRITGAHAVAPGHGWQNDVTVRAWVAHATRSVARVTLAKHNLDCRETPRPYRLVATPMQSTLAWETIRKEN
ncbi:hypothetical protein FMUAM8_18780 [Nocardia cyriacigeorgica]|nr:hypothetical protein FMUAM8_18780 [Nocardia cyriacigeorgica]